MKLLERRSTDRTSVASLADPVDEIANAFPRETSTTTTVATRWLHRDFDAFLLARLRSSCEEARRALTTTSWSGATNFFGSFAASTNLTSEPIRVVSADERSDAVLLQHVRDARELLNVSTEELARAIGVGRSTLFTWLNGTAAARPSSRRPLDKLLALTSQLLRTFGYVGARMWLESGTPSYRDLILAGRTEEVSRELSSLLRARRPLSERTRVREVDEEPARRDGDEV